MRVHIGSKTRVIDGRGRTVVPGLIDTHVHALGVAEAEVTQPFRNLRSIGELQAWIRSHAAANEIALEPTPKIVACTIAGASSPIIAPSAGIKAPVKKLATTKAPITDGAVAAAAEPSRASPSRTAPAVITVR